MKRRRSSFTVLELLAAVAVLSIILLLMAQITGMVNKAYGEGLGRVDNFTKSRAMLDLVVGDIRHAVLRPDLPAFQVGGTYTAGSGYSGGTPTNAFYTLQPAVTAVATPRNLSLVLYTLDTTNSVDKIALWRADDGASWANNSLQTFQGDMSGPLGNVQRREMAPGVVGFQFLFRQQNGTVTTTYPGYNASNPVISIGVAIAVIGDRALEHLGTGSSGQADQIGSIRSALAVSLPANATSLKSYWDNSVLTSGFFSGNGYPRDLGANLRTFERWIDCPAF